MTNARIDQLSALVAEMSDMLTQNAQVFECYAASHKEKGNAEKAEANAAIAEEIREFLMRADVVDETCKWVPAASHAHALKETIDIVAKHQIKVSKIKAALEQVPTPDVNEFGQPWPMLCDHMCVYIGKVLDSDPDPNACVSLDVHKHVLAQIDEIRAEVDDIKDKTEEMTKNAEAWLAAFKKGEDLVNARERFERALDAYRRGGR